MSLQQIPTQPKVLKPASKEKQHLRQQQVTIIQQKNQQKAKQSDFCQDLPSHMEPIADKYIFGLSNNSTADPSLKKATTNNDDEEEQDNLDPNLLYSPLDYNSAFDTKEILHTSRGKFCCFSAGPKSTTSEPELIFVCLHGAGHCALSWAAVTQLIKDKYQVFTFDYRAHGETQVEDEYAMSKNNLVADIIEVLHCKYGNDKDAPPLILVGHSLGGALAIHTSHATIADYPLSTNNNNTSVPTSKALPNCVGIIVVDLVEGTALNSLKYMPTIINRRPKSFQTIINAIKYCVVSGMIKNIHSARMSVPPMFVKSVGKGMDESDGRLDSILENEVDVELKESVNEMRDDEEVFVWRTDVLRTQSFWREWFLGLSKLFLSAPVTKMLMIADTDRLDKLLTIGQMQGKYELRVMGNGIGHTVHEDAPQKVADLLIHFAERNQFVKMWKLNQKFRK